MVTARRGTHNRALVTKLRKKTKKKLNIFVLPNWSTKNKYDETTQLIKKTRNTDENRVLNDLNKVTGWKDKHTEA